MKNMKTFLFKKDTTGKTRFISIEAVGDAIVQHSGVYGSEKFVTHVKNATPKNVGRSNETTPEQQAILEVESFMYTNDIFTTKDNYGSGEDWRGSYEFIGSKLINLEQLTKIKNSLK